MPLGKRGKLKQCLTRGVFSSGPGPGQAKGKGPAGPQIPFEDMCKEAVRLGIYGFDLVGANDWPTLKKYGLVCSMAGPNMGVSIPVGINDRSRHDLQEKSMRALIDQCAENGWEKIITVSGNKGKLTEEEGLSACADFLNRVKAQAEDKNVTICIELLNDKLDHPDQQCNSTRFGVEVCKRVNSPRVKVLYDIYHMQMMEGNVIATIKENFQWIAHFHTAGVPGRHEIDDTNELNYHLVAKTLAELNYNGYITHEYRPAPGHDPMKSLEQAIEIMTV